MSKPVLRIEITTRGQNDEVFVFKDGVQLHDMADWEGGASIGPASAEMQLLQVLIEHEVLPFEHLHITDNGVVLAREEFLKRFF